MFVMHSTSQAWASHRRPIEAVERSATSQIGLSCLLLATVALLFSWQASGMEPPLPAGSGAKAGANSTADKNALPPRVDLAGRVEDKAPIRSWQENPVEAKAYCEVVIHANQTSQEVFGRAARRDVTFAHLFEEPAKYRGEVIHVAGRLKRLRRFEAPGPVQQAGIPFIYEGWIFDAERYGANPTCVIFTELPSGLEVQEELDKRVGFDGYFFKRYRYQAQDAWRDAPLLIGNTIVLARGDRAASSGDGGPWTQPIVALILTVVGVSVGLILCLALWFRSSDRRIRRLLSDRRPLFHDASEGTFGLNESKPTGSGSNMDSPS
jgi:hypothetical protein